MKMKSNISERGPLALLLSVGLLVLGIGIALPVGSLLTMSFYGADGSFAGLANFSAYLSGPNVGRSLFNSMWLSALSAVISVSLAYGYAYALTQTCMPGRRFFRAVALLPILAPSLLMAISLIYLFGNQGLLKNALGFESIYGPPGIVIGSVLWTLPHALLIMLTALATSDGRLHEAAASLGAGRWRIFLTVTLPASRYGLLISLVVVFVMVLTDFGVPKVIGGNTQVLATDIYKQVIGQQRLQMGAVVALLLLLPAVLAFWVEQRLRRAQGAALTVRAVPYQPTASAGLDGVMLLYCSLIALLLIAVMGVAVFAAFATYWPYNLAPSFNNFRFDMMDGGGWASYGNSIKLALGCAVLGAGLTFLSAYLVEKPRRFAAGRGLLNAMASLPMAVPGLALGLGYILFFNAGWNPLHGLYGSLSLLIICTVAHFYSVAHITQLAALRQLDPEYELVAASLGVPFWTTLWRVHLPVSLPAMMQVAAYFFINAMTTVSAVVFLYSPETTLASVAVLAMDDAGDIGPAAAMAVLIFLTAAFGRFLIALLERVLINRTQAWRAR
ncbi:putative 2-aminoethylphosphonate ABC transporter permease subunit [Roseateles albus]|uniref:2-aminoethylphosphonate ABC transporter permease subunit n=1 Tax=Roseateles albus TaxID=2987525 RepID=A0ABT5KE70_9BURK|nr:putative 2-aminoethylphosphonate ABC transporter permease subunit [Roseateles albus]MDC8771121.1 putative 2-aminoethylphosphonate ABC transporter permease subunit [Roseateles albus]